MENQINEFQWNDWNPNPSGNESENNEQLNIEWQDQEQVNEFQWNDWNPNPSGNESENNEQLDQENVKLGWVDDNSNEENSNKNLPFSLIGKTDELYYHGFLYNLNCNNANIVNEIKNLNLIPKENDGRYEFSPQENSELGNFVKSLLKCSSHEHNLRIIDCNIIKCGPSESFLNVFNGKPPFNFIYVAQSDSNVGDIVLDFSAMGGPSFNTRKYEEGSLILIPGWVPYRISKNNSQQDHILICGMLG